MGQDVVKLTVDIQAKVNNLESELSKMQKAFNSLEGPEKLSSEIKGVFEDLENRLKKVKDYANNNQLKIIDSKKVQGELNEIAQDYNKLINRIGDNKSKFGLAEVSKEGVALKNAIEDYNKAVEKGKKPIEDQLKAYQKLQEEIKKAKINLEVKTERKNNAQANLDALSKQSEELKKQQDVLEQQSKQIKEQIKDTKDLLEKRKATLIEKGGAGARPQNLHMVDTLSKEATELKRLQSEQDKVNQSLEKAKEAITANGTELANAKRELTSATSSVTSAQHKLVDTEAKVGKELTEVNQKFGNQGITIKNLDTTIQDLEKSIEQLESGEFEKLKGSLAELEGKGLIKLGFDLNEIKTVEQFEQKLKEINEQEFDKVQIAIKSLIEGLKKGKEESEPLSENIREDTQATVEFGKELDRIGNRIKYFFGLDNAVRLFRQSVRKAIETVKDLDKVMTETAVVTNFSVGDMWKQLPEYTERANALGVSIHDMYEASTLYYQQGLKTNEVMAISNETLKMARIAGLNAEDATNRMTNALRGFNMEINESNAQNINDVYSNLAAKTASDVDEISTAMTKVASLANNANMSFENTAAFLSQIIETTRESAETAGTALKTVIARFSEVKELYTKGDLLGDVEGEEIDVNKVSKALRSAGIDLNEYLTGAKGLDQIFMELSEKWDNLDQVQQRYIATMAAGSRQQSRFIALMQDNARMTELVKEANNANGASQKQFEKTLESLQSKLNKLENAWNTYLMTLANNQVIKAVVDLLRGFLDAINKISAGVGKLSPMLQSFFNLGIAGGGLALGKGIFSKLFKDVGKIFKGEGKKGGESFLEGLNTVLKKKINLKADSFKEETREKKENIAVTKTETKAKQESSMASKAEAQGRKEVIDVASKEAAVKEEASKATEENIISNEAQAKITEEVAIAKEGEAKVTEENAVATAEENRENTENIITEEGKVQGSAESAIAKEGEAKATEENVKATAEENAINKGGIRGLLTLIGLRITGAGATKVEAKSTKISTKEKIKNTAAQWGLNGAMLVGLAIVGAIIVAVIALVAAIVLLIKAIQDVTPEAQLEAASEAAEEAAQSAENATKAFDDLKDSLDNLSDSYNNLDKLTEGTEEWKEELKKVNGEVIDLIDKYPELNKFVSRNEKGLLTLDLKSQGVQDILNSYEKRALSLRIAAQGAKVYEASRAYLVAQEKYTQYDVTSSNTGIPIDVTESDSFDALQDSIEKNSEVIEKNALEARKNEYELEKATEENTEAIKAANTIIRENIIEKLGLEGEEAAVAGNIVSDELIASYVKGILDGISREQIGRLIETGGATLFNPIVGAGLGRKLEVDLMSQWIEAMGYIETSRDVFGNITYLDAEGNSSTVKRFDESMRAEMAYVQGIDEIADLLPNLIKVINQNSTLYKAFLKEEGRGLSKKDIENIVGEDFYNSFKSENVTKEQVREQIEASEYFGSLGLNEDSPQYKAILDGLTDAIYLGAKQSTDLFKNSLIDLNSLNSNLTDKLSIDQLQGLEKELSIVLSAGGEKALNKVTNSMSALLETIPEDEWDSFVSAFNSIDWKDLEQVENFDEVLDRFGVTVDYSSEQYKNFIESMKNGAHSIATVDLNGIVEKVQNLQKVIKRLQTESTSQFSEEEYNAIIAGNEGLSSQFVKIGDEYIYLGTKIEDLIDALNANTEALVGGGREQLAAEIHAADVISDLERKSDYGALAYSSDWSEIDKRKFIQSVILGGLTSEEIDALDISWLSADTNAYTDIPIDELDTILKAFLQIRTSKSNNKIKLEDLDKAGLIAQYQNQKPEDIAKATREGSAEEREAALKALAAQGKIAGVTSEVYADYFKFDENGDVLELIGDAEKFASIINSINEAISLGLDTTELDNFAKQLHETYGYGYEEAYKLALANAKLNKGYKEIKDTYDDWKKLIIDKKIKAETTEDIETFNKLKNAVKTMVNASEDLSDAFWEDEEVLELLQKAAEGDTEALEGLQKKAMKDYLLKIGVDKDSVNAVYDYLNNINLPTLEAGIELDREEYGEFIDELYAMMVAADMTADQINEALGRIGYEVEIEWVYVDNPFKPSGKERVPEIHFVSTGSGGGGLNKPPKNPGGGGSSKNDKWKNPYDELFNLQERINEALREREALEREYQKLLKSSTSSISEIRQGYLDQIEALREAIRLQEQLQAGRMRQIQNLLSETYTDENGREHTFASYGVDRYAYYDFESGQIVIDWDALERLSQSSNNNELGAAIEAYISKLQELVDSYEGVRDEIWNIEDQIDQLTEELINSYTDFEDRVMEALVAQYTKEIDAFENMSNAINEATTKVLDGIQEQIDAQRQARDNAKTEDEIARKEARLAYLRRDTSGANSLEIMQLEKELEEARQNYEDTLIDQALEQMRKDADLAADQRAQQIQIMRDQLDMWQDTGALWDEVYGLINDAVDPETGEINMDSELIKLLQASENFNSFSAFGQDNWLGKIIEDIWRALAGLAAGGADQAGQHQGEGGGGETTPPGESEPGEGAGGGNSAENPEWPSNLPKPSEATRTYKTGDNDAVIGGHGVKAIQTALNMINEGVEGWTPLSEDGIFGAKTKQAVKRFQAQGGLTADGIVGRQTRNWFGLNQFKTGGLANFTGPAWLDGTNTHPELVLNAVDTQNFIALKNILAQLLSNQSNGQNGTTVGDAYFDIDINAEIGSDYDVDKLADRIKEQIFQDSNYRNINVMNFIH